MKILLYSPAFAPSVGGLETVVAILAEELVKLGCEVVVVTTTRGVPHPSNPQPYPIIRNPTPRELLRWTRWCEVYFQANVSLRGLWPLLFVRRPWAVSHHSWYCRTDGRVAWADRLKRFLTRRAALSIAVSHAMADDLGPDTRSNTRSNTIVIGNPYREDIFRPHPEVPRDRDLVTVGRLVSDKGFDLLLEALAILAREKGASPALTLIGEGPERRPLETLAARLGIADRVEFTGGLTSPEIARHLAAHRVLVVPSRYREPFGLVALEGIACGCAVIASEGGGLPDAVGPCGVTFPNGDAAALAAAISELLGSESLRTALLEHASEHLARHERARVARSYLDALSAAFGNRETTR